MSKSTLFEKGEIIETFSNFNEGITSNIRGSKGMGDVRHGHVYPNRIIPRAEMVEESPSYNIEALAVRPPISASDSNDKYFGLSIDDTNRIVSKQSFSGGSWSSHLALSEIPVTKTPFVIYGFRMWWIGDGSKLQAASTAPSATEYPNLQSGFGAMTGSLPFVFVYHPEYDNLYILEKSAVSQIDGTTVSKNVLNVSAYKTLTAGAPYGSYLAMGQFDPATVTSTLLLWNVNTEVPYVEPFAWGDGEIIALGELGTHLIGVTLEVGNNANELKRMVFQRFNGSTIEYLGEILGDGLVFDPTADVIQPKSDGQRLYFKGLARNLGNTTRSNVIISVDKDGNVFSDISIDDASNNVYDFVKQNNRIMVAHSVPHKIHKSSQTPTYTYETVAVSLICDGNNPHLEKTLKEIIVPHDKLPAGAAIKFEIREPGDVTWTHVGTKDKEGSYRSTLAKNTILNKPFPKFNELLVRITSTGGAVIKPFKVVSEFKSSDKVRGR